MAVEDKDNRIARILGRKKEHPIIREDGGNALPPQSAAGPGQVDVTLRNDYEQANRADAAQREAERARKAQPSFITQPSNVPDEDTVVEIGNVVVYKNPLSPHTYEAHLTRGGLDPVVVEVDGERLSAEAGLQALYSALVAQKCAKK